jgi:hypothetical protein
MNSTDDEREIKKPSAGGMVVVVVVARPTPGADLSEIAIASDEPRPDETPSEPSEAGSSISRNPSGEGAKDAAALGAPPAEKAGLTEPHVPVTDEPAVPVAPAFSVPISSAPAVEKRATGLRVSRVQQVAEAFHRRSSKGVPTRDTQAIAPTRDTQAIAPTRDTQATVVVSPMVVLDDQLELQEMAPCEVASCPVAKPMPEQEVTPSEASSPWAATVERAKDAVLGGGAGEAEPLASSSSLVPAEMIAIVPECGDGCANPAAAIEEKASSDRLAVEKRSEPSLRSLALDSEVAVEFFSQRPPPSLRLAGEIEQEPYREVTLPPTSRQLARQRYYRSLVLKVMLVAIVLVVVAAFLVWRRGQGAR